MFEITHFSVVMEYKVVQKKSNGLNLREIIINDVIFTWKETWGFNLDIKLIWALF